MLPKGIITFEAATGELKARTQWLAPARANLDAAVAAAYGWPAEISDDDALRELLAMNLGHE